LALNKFHFCIFSAYFFFIIAAVAPSFSFRLKQQAQGHRGKFIALWEGFLAEQKRFGKQTQVAGYWLKKVQHVFKLILLRAI